MMKQQRGIILVVILIMNAVIAMLILGNMNSLLINTKLIKAFTNKQQLNIILRANHQKFIKQFNFSDSNCLYKLKQQASYPTLEQNDKWCQWHNNSNQLYLFRVWDQGINCCFKTSSAELAHFYYLQFKIIKHNNSSLISTFIRSDMKDNCNCKKVSVIKEGIITQLIT